MSAALALAQAEAAGVRFRLDGGRVRMEADSAPPPAIVADLRRWREGVARLLAEREGVVPFLAAAGAAMEALASPDAELAHERREIAAALAAEARGEHGAAATEAGHGAAVGALLAAGRQRPPAWSDASATPSAGSWCSCCGRMRKAAGGGRWWREAEAPKGWRCATCHPPDRGAAVVQVVT